jgi:hypothetical protein
VYIYIYIYIYAKAAKAWKRATKAATAAAAAAAVAEPDAGDAAAAAATAAAAAAAAAAMKSKQPQPDVCTLMAQISKLRATNKALRSKCRKSSVATGRNSKAMVIRGSKAKTSGGLTKDKLVKNKRNKVVSQKCSARAKERFANSGLQKWALAVKAARAALNVTGFVTINGKTPMGKAIYEKAHELYA